MKNLKATSTHGNELALSNENFKQHYYNEIVVDVHKRIEPPLRGQVIAMLDHAISLEFQPAIKLMNKIGITFVFTPQEIMDMSH